MAPESNVVEQAVARALRDNLERIQRTSDELQQSINDIVAACSSSKPLTRSTMLRARPRPPRSPRLSKFLHVSRQCPAARHEALWKTESRHRPRRPEPPLRPRALPQPSRTKGRRTGLLPSSNRFEPQVKPSSTSPKLAPSEADQRQPVDS